MTSAERAIEHFQARFLHPPEHLIRSPGRVNLIGDHTDYNDGFVLPMAIDRALWIALRPRPDRKVYVWSDLGNDWGEFSLDAPRRGGGWSAYPQGVGNELQRAGHRLTGWNGAIVSEIPTGAGLSSSAALEIGTARAFDVASGLDLDPLELAIVSQRAENDWVGVECGIMDQLICAAGEADHALLIDCRDLTWDPIPVPEAGAVIVLDTGTRRELVDSAYNDRRASCQRASFALGVRALRDADPETLEASENAMDPLTHRRARHVITENARTLQMADALVAEDLKTAGRLMTESHASLRDDFEVSSPALDAMVEAAGAAQGCLGVRMTGAGFGGSCVALVAADQVDEFESETLEGYRSATGATGTAIRVEPSDGASTETVG